MPNFPSFHTTPYLSFRLATNRLSHSVNGILTLSKANPVFFAGDMGKEKEIISFLLWINFKSHFISHKAIFVISSINIITELLANASRTTEQHLEIKNKEMTSLPLAQGAGFFRSI